jgi:RHS repeat-associated protein
MKNSRIAKLIGIGLLVTGLFGSVFGQQHTENKADQTLRGSGRVNPSTLGMEFDLPLGSYSGRGISVPIGLSYSSKVWRMDSIGSFRVPAQGGQPRCVNVNEARFGENSASGWTTSMQEAYVEYTGYDNRFNEVGFGVSNEIDCFPPAPVGTQNGLFGSYIKRIQIHLPSGESHELRMDDTPVGYANYEVGLYHPDTDANWNGWYYAVDGSNLRYFEDRTNNVYKLQLPDGSYYSFSNAKAPNANYNFKTIRTATKFSDRNGNFTTYHEPTNIFPNGYWTDTMGRSLSVPMPRKAPNTTGIQDYFMPGMTGQNPINYKFHWKKLKDTTATESALTDFSQNLKYVADFTQPPGNNIPPPRNGETTLFLSGWSSWVVDTYTIANVPAIFNPILLTAIEMPNGQMYRFSYNIFGEIDKVIYPAGGKETFIYDKVPPLTFPAFDSSLNNQANRGIVNRKVYENDNAIPLQTTYSAEYVAPNGFQIGYKVATINPDLTRTERIVNQGKRNINNQTNGDWGFDRAITGMAYDESSFSPTGQITSKKLTYWTSDYVVINNTYEKAERNPRVTKEESIIYDTLGNGLSTTTTIEYEGDLTQRETPLLTKKSSQYKFVTVGSPLPNAPERTSETQYLQSDPNILQSTKDAYKAQNMVGLATSSVVKDAAGIIVSRSEMGYDDTGYSPNIGRGNPTTSRVWDSTKGVVTNPTAYISTRAKFDSYGNQTESTDAKGNISTTEYSSIYNYAFPTKVTTPIPSDGVSGSNTAFITTVVYDPITGLPTSTTDANGLESRIEYDPLTLRPIRSRNYYQNSQVGGTSETVYHDEPNNYWVKSRTQIDATNWAEGITYSDGLGRAFKSEKLDSQGSIFTETEFDAVGRPKRSTNPYRANEAKVWTTTNYDSQSRPFEVVTSDGAKVTTAFGLSTSGTEIGTVVTVTDQANKKRRSITNALGQLIRVDEPNDAGQLDVNGVPAQSTKYAYDTLNNLVAVNQGVQTRTFQYDSLSRLKQANNPESGIINYLYDNNSNLTSKTDARNVVTNYVYDNLNRVKTRSYPTPNPLPTNYQTTPNVAYTYDNLPNAKGKLIKVNSSVSTTEYTSFDILGRVQNHKQRTDNNDYTTAYTYNLSGALIEETYPSGRVVKNTLDIDGDLQQVQSRKSNGTLQNYANAFTYTSAGAVSNLRLGNGKFENTTFNSRLQPIQIGLGSSATSQNLLKLNFEYGGSDNNGNVKSQIVTTPTVGNIGGFVATQVYSYDSLNRIHQATETVANQPTQGWQQTFVYDRYGNRTFDEANTTTLPKNCGTAPNKVVCTSDIAKFNPSANVGDNKLVGTNYDSVGNTKIDANGQTFVYDAENKQVQVSNAGGIVGKYWYNGDGQRVKKYVPSTQETTIFVYDASNKLVAEYSTITASPAEAKISYLTNDHLGSPRITTDGNGQVVSRRDFMPFGEEITRAGSGSDSVRQKFTGYERDNETNLDYAKARMFGSGLGRFTSPDNFLNDTRPVDPKSWNLYVYARNNPLRLVDPSGEKAKIVSKHNKETNTTTISVTASFAVYGVDGQGISKEELEKKAALFKAGIEKAYSRQFDGKDGRKFEISASITVNVVDSEQAAIESGSDNIVGVGKMMESEVSDDMTNEQREIVDPDGDGMQDIGGVSIHSVEGESFDRMAMSAGYD